MSAALIDVLTKGERREQKRHKKRHGMKMRGRSLKSTVVRIIADKAEDAKNETSPRRRVKNQQRSSKR